jgi:D-aspartate ligase
MTPVIVLGTGLTSLGVLRILRRARIPAFVFGWPVGVEQQSRWNRPVPLSRPLPASCQDLRQLLSAIELPAAVLMPCSDHWALQVAEMPEAFRERFRASIAPAAAIRKLVDKAPFSQLLLEAGVPHPLTRLLSSPADLNDVPDDVLEGAFLKPHDSQEFFARFGVKAFRIQSRAEGLERMAQAERAGLAVLLQQYIPGPGSLHYFVDGFVDASGRLRAAFTRRRLRMHPADFGNSSCMVSVPREEMGQAIEAATRALSRLGFRGIFSAEFKQDPRDGVFKLLEVNARPWWYIEFAERCGVDFCRLAYDDALGLPLNDVVGHQVGARMVYPYYDYFACRDARRAKELSLGQWARSWIGAQQPMFNWSDPMPALAELWKVGRQSTGKALRGVAARE